MNPRYLTSVWLLTALLAIGCKKSTPPTSPAQAAETPPAITPPPSQVGGPIALTSDEWGEQAVSALSWPDFDEKYKGKSLRISGTIASFGTDVVYLHSNAKGGDFADGVLVWMTFPPDTIDGLKLKKGDRVVIDGKYSMLNFGGPGCSDCALVSKK